MPLIVHGHAAIKLRPSEFSWLTRCLVGFAVLLFARQFCMMTFVLAEFKTFLKTQATLNNWGYYHTAARALAMICEVSIAQPSLDQKLGRIYLNPPRVTAFQREYLEQHEPQAQT